MCRAEDEDNIDLTFISLDGDACSPNLIFLSGRGCPLFTFDVFTEFINDYYYLWGAGLIVLGIFLSFLGNKFVNVVIFVVITFGSISILGKLLFNLFLTKV